MRVAVLIIGLVLSFGLFIQAFIILGLSDAVNQEKTEQAGALGVFMAFLWLIAVALVIPFPRAAAVIFAVATVFGVGGASDYPDLWIWSVISVVLAVMSYFGYRGKKQQQAKEEERDDLMRQMAASQATIAAAQRQSAQSWCQSCGAGLEAGARFCGSCGSAVAVRQ
ncbi:hypothetical protein BH24CHL4_BH24CHL4_17340 [soil metagenome]